MKRVTLCALAVFFVSCGEDTSSLKSDLIHNQLTRPDHHQRAHAFFRQPWGAYRHASTAQEGYLRGLSRLYYAFSVAQINYAQAQRMYIQNRALFQRLQIQSLTRRSLYNTWKKEYHEYLNVIKAQKKMHRALESMYGLSGFVSLAPDFYSALNHFQKSLYFNSLDYMDIAAPGVDAALKAGEFARFNGSKGFKAVDPTDVAPFGEGGNVMQFIIWLKTNHLGVKAYSSSHRLLLVFQDEFFKHLAERVAEKQKHVDALLQQF